MIRCGAEVFRNAIKSDHYESAPEFGAKEDKGYWQGPVTPVAALGTRENVQEEDLDVSYIGNYPGYLYTIQASYIGSRHPIQETCANCSITSLANQGIYDNCKSINLGDKDS